MADRIEPVGFALQLNGRTVYLLSHGDDVVGDMARLATLVPLYTADQIREAVERVEIEATVGNDYPMYWEGCNDMKRAILHELSIQEKP